MPRFGVFLYLVTLTSILKVSSSTAWSSLNWTGLPLNRLFRFRFIFRFLCLG